MKVTINQPHRTQFKDLKTGTIFVHEVGVYIKTDDGYPVCLHKVAGRMGDEGRQIPIQTDAYCTTVVEATFTVGNM